YCYEYMDDRSKFDETALPPIENFFSSLRDEHISQDDYERGKKVWDTFDMKTLQDYHDLYLKSDVLLLADVFENYRKLTLESFGLDPANFISLPQLSLSAVLKYTQAESELLTDIDQLLFLEKGIRGGVSTIVTRYAEANNIYLPDYDPNLENKYIQYLDENSLYAWAMSESLPINGFKFLN